MGLFKLSVNVLHGLSDMLFNRCVCLFRDTNGIPNWKDEDQGAAAGVTCAFACDVPSTCRWRLLELYFSSSAQHLLCCVQHCYLLGLMFHSWIVLCWRKTLQLFSIRWAILGTCFPASVSNNVSFSFNCCSRKRLYFDANCKYTVGVQRRCNIAYFCQFFGRELHTSCQWSALPYCRSEISIGEIASQNFVFAQ